MIIGDYSSFGYWLERSPKFVLERAEWSARLIADWTKAFGKERAAEMVSETTWVEPVESLLRTAWGS